MKEFNDVLSRVTAKVFVQIVEKEVESLIVNETADEETYSEFKYLYVKEATALSSRSSRLRSAPISTPSSMRLPPSAPSSNNTPSTS